MAVPTIRKGNLKNKNGEIIYPRTSVDMVVGLDDRTTKIVTTDDIESVDLTKLKLDDFIYEEVKE